MESNKFINSVMHYKNKKHRKNKKENSPKNKVADCVIIESFNAETSDNNIDSNKFYKKKRKHKENNEQTIPDCRISEMGMQELSQNKKHKLTSRCEMENVCNYKNKESNETDNNLILDELYKRKRHHKQTKVDNMFNCLNSDLNDIGLSENNLNDGISNDAYKQKGKKRHNRIAAENLLKTTNMESNQISDITGYFGGIEGIISNSDDQNISKLDSRNDMHSEMKPENQQKKKYKCIDDRNKFDCEIIQSAITETSINNANSNKFLKKKRKQAMDDKNVFECCIVQTDVQELDNDTNYCTSSKDLKKRKGKKDKHKLLSITENGLNCQESATDKSGKKIILNMLEMHEGEVQHNYAEINKISDCKTTESNVIDINQNGLSSKTFSKSHKKKKKHKSFDVMENISDCKISDSDIIEINDDHSKSENFKRLHEGRECKKKVHKLPDEIEIIYDCNTVDSNDFEINQNVSESENCNRFRKKKKKKHKLFVEMENIPVDKTADSNTIEINQNDSDNEHLNQFHKKKKKKHTKNFSEIKNIHDDSIQESVIDKPKKNSILDAVGVQKGNECRKKTDVDKTSDLKIIDSIGNERNQNDLSSETLDGLHKPKRKKNRHNLTEVENIPIIVVESNNVNCHEHTNKDKEKSIVENSVEFPKRNKKHMESKIIRLSDNLLEKEKNVSKRPEKNDEEVEDAYISFDPFINDVVEVPVSFPVPLLHEGETAATITPETRKYLESNGVTIHSGKWTKTEDDILTKNFKQFGLDFGVNNPFQLLGINQTKNDAAIIKFKRAKHFLVRLGKDLNNRSLRSIYMRARKLLNPLKNKEKLSAEEAADLRHAHRLVGNKWTRISDMLSRSDHTCHTAYRWHKSNINKGKWTPEENNNLIKAIKTVCGTEDISANNIKTISWKAVSLYVPTRNEFQCQKQWAEHLAWDSSVTERKSWDKYDYGKLIYLLKDKYCFNSEHEIDWRELHKYFINTAPSHIFVHKKWLYLKGRLPKDIHFTYNKCLDAFKKMYKNEYKIFAEEKL